MHRKGLVCAFGPVFVFQPVLDDLVLQRPNGANDLPPVQFEGEQLGHAFIHQLVYTLGQLFCLHRIGIVDISEVFGGKGRDALIIKGFPLGKRVSDLEVASVVKPYDIPRERLVYDCFFLGKKGIRAGEFKGLPKADVEVRLVPFEFSRNHFHKGQAVPVFGVHIGVDFKDKPRHLGFP